MTRPVTPPLSPVELEDQAIEQWVLVQHPRFHAGFEVGFAKTSRVGQLQANDQVFVAAHAVAVRLNQAFAQLSDRLQRADDGKPGPALLALSHLLIDEFQDISPQIVLWLQAVHRRLHATGERISLMAIGDDWQSIYGWRGSSPKYFMEFTKAFPSPANTRVMLVDNYRCQHQVIDAAEHLVKGTPAIAGKKARASGPAAELPGSAVKVFDRDEAALGETLIEHYQRGESVMMLSAPKSARRRISAGSLTVHTDTCSPCFCALSRRSGVHSVQFRASRWHW